MELTKRIEHNKDRLIWALAGEHGGIHIWCSANFSYGGLELHAKEPIYEGQSRSDEDCWLIGCPCYHDGSSLWWNDYGRYDVSNAICQKDITAIWDRLESIYCERFVEAACQQ